MHLFLIFELTNKHWFLPSEVEAKVETKIDFTLPLRKKLQIFEPNCCSLANRDLPNPSPIFLVRSAFTWHYLRRNQFHSKKYFYISSFLQLFTANFQIYLIILKKWMDFCLQFEALLRNFFLFLWQLNLLQSEGLAQLRQQLRLSICY